jgi:hypothetical protein
VYLDSRSVAVALAVKEELGGCVETQLLLDGVLQCGIINILIVGEAVADVGERWFSEFGKSIFRLVE